MSNEPSEITFSDEDIAALNEVGIATDGEPPSWHAILQVWRDVLRNAETELEAKVTPQWAARITSSYAELQFRDMVNFRNRYFSKILELLTVVEDQIATDDECLNVTSPEEDAERNARHYKEVLKDWQLTYLGWELDWDCLDPDAAVEIAAIAEAHKMFFGQNGLTQQLENLKFEYTEADQAAVAEALRAKAEEHKEANGE